MSHDTYPTARMLSSDNAQEQGLKDFFAALRRRRKIIFLITAVAVIGTFLCLISAKDLYEAKAMVLVQPTDTLTAQMQESVLLSTVEELRSYPVIKLTLEDLKAEATEEAIRSIQNDLVIKPLNHSSIITVSYRNDDAAFSADIINHLIKAYQQIQSERQADEAEKAGRRLDKYLAELSAKVETSAQAVEHYRVAHNLADNEQDDTTARQLNDINTQLIQAQSEQFAAQALWVQIQQAQKDKMPLDTIEKIAETPLIVTLKHDEAVLLAEHSELQSKYGANHPRMKAIGAELAQVRARKNAELQTVSQSLQNDVLIADAKIESLERRSSELRDQRAKENQTGSKFAALKRAAKADRLVYDDFLDRYKDIMIAGKLSQPTVKVIAEARVPHRPIGSPMAVILFMAAAIGLIFGIIATLMLEHLEASPKDR